MTLQPCRFRAAGLRLLRARASEVARACDSGCLPDPALRAKERRVPDRNGTRRGDDRRDRRRHGRLRRVLAAASADPDGRCHPAAGLGQRLRGTFPTRGSGREDCRSMLHVLRRLRASHSPSRPSGVRFSRAWSTATRTSTRSTGSCSTFRSSSRPGRAWRSAPAPGARSTARTRVGGPRPTRSCTCLPTARSE